MSDLDQILFTLGSLPISIGVTLVGVLALALLIALIAVMSSNRGTLERAEMQAAQNLESVRSGLNDQILQRDSRLREIEGQLQHERERATEQMFSERDRAADMQAELAAMRTRLDEQARNHATELKRFTEARQQMTDEFKAIAGDVMRTHSETFTKQNREQVDVLLKPLQEKITEFHQGLIRDRSAMSEQIRALSESNLQITTEAQNLTRALKGSSQTQGAWGEMILSTILEQSGLREGEQYFTQQSHTIEDNQRLRTDVEIRMPNGDVLVIDSKVSLTAFESFVNSPEDERETYLRAHIHSVRTHITTLGAKGYNRAAKSSLDYVMMFVPIESALATAIQHDAKLVEFGMSKGVMLTTPTTLMTVLRTVRNVWDIEKRHQNAEEIAERAGKLYEKVAGFLSSMDQVEKGLNTAQANFAKAKDQLSSGRGNVVRQIEQLRDLGAKTSKSLPPGWEGRDDDAPVLKLVNDEPLDLN
ncbi:DNA recombination protein RmuC [Devosia sp. MC521]|uniref:DNA recombination protein RmuC n=1 Tax=Devosia sp. MC521 TaxID=2759954 RepID=UPI0015FD7D8E|nr:DNA recombination protein RmuC [Devosia sp. MC521]MBJ6988778.1 DNA recombination protein RmuC [Devosia sp. MC521]QMW63087.1 DNA recombination protein RmuC [Devosia sp. MC521]